MKKIVKTGINYNKIIDNSFFNLIREILMEFSKIKTDYKLELLIDLTNKKTKIPDKCRQDYSEDEVIVEINAKKAKLELKKDYFTTYITNNEDNEIYKIEVPYNAIMCIIDNETGYTIDYSMTDDINKWIQDIDESESGNEYDIDDTLDDNKFINAIINITSRCINGSAFSNNGSKQQKKNLKKIQNNEKKENKIIYFKNILTIDKEKK